MDKEVLCPKCGSEFYGTLTVEEVEKYDFDNELMMIETVICEDCQNQFSLRSVYKLDELYSEVVYQRS